MKLLNVFIVIVLVFIINACTPSQTKQYKQVVELEEEVYSMKMLDREKGSDLINAYVDYATSYPEDSASVHFLFKAGDVAMNMGMGSQAILYYDKVMVMNPEFRKAPESLFLKAFVFENQLQDLEQAEKNYKLFIEKYPNHVLAKDAEASLKYLGKSPEELIQMFQSMNLE